MAVSADFTPADLDLLLRDGHHTEIVLDFGVTDFTGSTGLRVAFAASRDGVGVDVQSSFELPSTIRVVIGAAEWATMPRRGTWQVEHLDPSGDRAITVDGSFAVESSL